MSNNSMISVMFEEIKSLIASVDKKIDERLGTPGSSVPNTPFQSPVEERDTSPLEKSIQQMLFHLIGVQKRLNQNSETVRESEKHVISHIEELKQRSINSKTDTSIHHYHVVDLKSSKVVLIFGVLSIVLLGSLTGNIYQIREIDHMNDNDIKYRYIKLTNGISPENLYKLENIFHYNRDKMLINGIRNDVEDYERKVKERAAELERTRLIEGRSEKLKQKAEKLRK